MNLEDLVNKEVKYETERKQKIIKEKLDELYEEAFKHGYHGYCEAFDRYKENRNYSAFRMELRNKGYEIYIMVLESSYPLEPSYKIKLEKRTIVVEV